MAMTDQVGRCGPEDNSLRRPLRLATCCAGRGARPNRRLQPAGAGAIMSRRSSNSKRQAALQTSMLTADAYRDNLAYIHDAGHGAIARDAAEKLITELAIAGHPRGTIVDLGCGSGILAEALVEAGYHVVGIDTSGAMVALARSRVPNADFQVGSFVSADIPTCVAVTAIGEVVNYAFDPANTEAALSDLVRRAYEALASGGILLFDIAGPDRAQSGESHRTHATGCDWAVIVETSVEPGTGVLTRQITSFRQVGDLYRRDDEVHRLLLRETEAVLELLRVAGFETEILPRYGSVPLPRGVVPFLSRKPVPHAVWRWPRDHNGWRRLQADVNEAWGG